MGKRAYINDGNDNWIPLVSSLPNMDAYATIDYVSSLVQNIDLSSASAAAVTYLVDSAPNTLDTLNELAQALGEDSNFATTVTNSLANKLDISTASATYQEMIPYSSSTPVDSIAGDLWVDSSTTPPALKVFNGTSWAQLGAAVDDSQAIISNRVF